jgi:unsaturated rhamnogalacturonyl hydrolase
MHWRWAALSITVIGCALVGTHPGEADPAPVHQELDQRIREVAGLPGEPSVFESMGVTRLDVPLRSIESREPLDGPRRRLVLVGGLDGNDRGTDAVLGAVRWFKTQAPASLREAWSVVALPCGNPEGWAQLKPTNDSGGKPAYNYPPQTNFFNDRQNVEARYVWRWLAFQAPDLVVEVRGGNRMNWFVPPAYTSLGTSVRAQPLLSPDTLAMALSRPTPSGLGVVPAMVVDARSTDGPELLRLALQAAANLPRSPMRQAVIQRLRRDPLEVASALARKYPQTPSVAYIPAVAWSATLRLSQLKNDPALVAKVKSEMAPWLNGARPSVNEKPDGVNLAGHIGFADLAALEKDEAARKLALDAAALFMPEEADAPARFGQLWCENMFFSATLLGRAGKLSDNAAYHDLMARTLTQYAQKLQRPGGLFQHAADSPFAWGRGNGFASLGLMEALTHLPPNHPRRGEILAIYRKQMEALKGIQTPEGTWRQVIDRPESYREVTATAMNLAAMARGIRLGWLDRSFLPVAERAWRGLSARIVDDGGLADVCTGTGAGPTLRYYYERPAIFGFDDRGGAMSLLAAIEMAELKR